ncbi:MAG: 3-hydroxybutyryl-CoA dehydrogenase [Firmicutes bacterium]|nr:3-hydroxybutyryl-CoA dehydrogenase [Candidatus Fermentithermobacillaceae bacterium]
MSEILGVVGLGTMGQGIAEVAARAGYTVIVLDRDEDLVQRGLSAIKKSLARSVEKGRISQEEMDQALGRLVPGKGWADLAQADVVIEAVFEDMAVKKEVLRELSKHVSADALLGSNTSALSITEMASVVPNPGRFIGIHFFNPVPVMKLVEIVKGKATGDRTVERALEFAGKLGKEAVLVAESPGFIVNRILCPMMNEAAYLVYEGVASAEDVDKAMKLGANHPIGPLALADLVGIDVLYSIMQTLEKNLGPKYKPCPLLEQMVKEGRLGRKTGRGFYQY